MTMLNIHGCWPEALNVRLTERNISTTDVALACGVDTSTVRRWRSKNKIGWIHIGPIMAITGLPVSVFMDNEFLTGRDKPWVAIKRPETKEDIPSIVNSDLSENILTPASEFYIRMEKAKARAKAVAADKSVSKSAPKSDIVKKKSSTFSYDDDNRPYAETSLRAGFATVKEFVSLDENPSQDEFAISKDSSAIAESVIAELEVIQAKRVRSFLPDMNIGPARTCQYITSPDDKHVRTTFCGKQSVPGKSYCLEHAMRCFMKTTLIRA